MKYSIVVTEDEILLKDNLIKKIHNLDLDFEVVGSAQTGVQGLELIQTLQPDLLITDIHMPVMDGLTLIKEVRDQYPNVDCIIISGYSEFDYAKKAIHYDVKEYLLKPIDDNDLYTALSNLQTRYRLRDSEYYEIFSQGTIGQSPTDIAATLHAYLYDHFNEDIKISQIAAKLNYSSSYLTKLFCNEYKLSPSKYLISIRMQKAQQLLKHNPELSIRQIGEAIGYPEQGYFSRIFKKQVGVSPLEYRTSSIFC